MLKRHRWLLAPGFWVASAVVSAHAQVPDPQARAWAATCATCHGTQGHSASAVVIPSLAGRPTEGWLAQWQGLQTAPPVPSVMHQLAKAYTEAEWLRIGAYFAALPPDPNTGSRSP